ncbi:hypothetical protein ALC57_04098 [Trachymyrmex cornetzi]|uniref:SWIM-type domain-containing protein n=1 Tax=Trachymyrmex cornetzi TaxID=471704 RepID=A0A151JCH8_9HYME|nr:hypothetical protein ALC57_04098 [Trachymyrmex cornetzi]
MFEYYKELKSEHEITFDMNNIDSVDDSTFKAWFAYNKEEFKKICTYAEKSNSVHVGVLLCKLRTALSNQQISFLFGVCETTVGNYIKIAIEDLIDHLVPKFINSDNRTELINHVTPMSKALFDIPIDKTCLIFDATYRLVKKSKNYSGQKQSWSEQKKCHLFVLGPFDATHNDATILKDCFQRYPSEMSIIHENDVILVDRGFRDVIQFLTEHKGVKVHCPGLGQLNTLDANLSRFVTKCRWIVEQVFARLKMKFKIFAIPAHNSTLIHDYQALLIAFALLNLFHQPILSDRINEDVAVLMKSRLHIPNQLQSIVEKFNLSKVRAAFLQIEYVTLDNVENNQQLCFPHLTLEDLYSISLGPYQIQNAISYYAEHQNEGIFLVSKFQPDARHRTAAIRYTDFNITIQDPILIKAYMKSRYRGGKHHHIFVLFDKALTGRNSIKEYFCTCESGARTVGCCSHIMTIIWYLGYGQYHEISTPNPGICDVSITIPKEKPQPIQTEN